MSIPSCPPLCLAVDPFLPSAGAATHHRPRAFGRDAEVFRALAIANGLLRHVARGFSFATIPARGREIGFAIRAAIAKCCDVIAFPILASADLARAQMAAAVRALEGAQPHARRNRRIVGRADPFGYGAAHALAFSRRRKSETPPCSVTVWRA